MLIVVQRKIIHLVDVKDFKACNFPYLSRLHQILREKKNQIVFLQTLKDAYISLFWYINVRISRETSPIDVVIN